MEKLNSAAMSLVLTPSSRRFLTLSRVSWVTADGMMATVCGLELLFTDVRRVQNFEELMYGRS